MRRILVLLTALLQVCALQAQPRLDVGEADSKLAQRWLHTDCLAPDAKALVDQLISRRAAMQIAFTRALAEGPPAEEVAAVRAAATARWRAQRKFLDNPELQNALPSDQWKSLSEGSENAAIRTDVDNFVSGYRSNAMSGLAVVGDEQALRQLRELAGRANRPEGVAARGALTFRESLNMR